MEKFEKLPPAKKIRISDKNKRKAEARRKIEMIQEDKDLVDEMDLLNSLYGDDTPETGHKTEN